jgi:hypothetical protein
MQALILKTLLIYGLAIVVSMLIAVVIKGIVVGIKVFKRAPVRHAPSAVAARTVAGPDIGADHVAAIAAAVYAMIGAHRIVHIEAGQRGGDWVSGGRAAHHASHDVAHHPRR